MFDIELCQYCLYLSFTGHQKDAATRSSEVSVTEKDKGKVNYRHTSKTNMEDNTFIHFQIRELYVFS